MPNKQTIDKGFSIISHQYEELEKTSGLINWMRNRVRLHLLKQLPKKASILEVNCGTGIDAVFLAKNGYQVYATDIAKGMIDYVKNKITKDNLSDNLSCQLLSFTELEKLKLKKINHIFSNFGGLNCSSEQELQTVFNSFNDLLLSKGKITLVIMPKVCLWEFAKIFKGNKTAFRRLKKEGVLANIEGEKVPTYYHSAKKIKQLLTPNFTDFKIENICFLGPTGNRVNFTKKHPLLFRFLTKFDAISNKVPLLRGFGDYYIITATKKRNNYFF